MIDDPVLVFCVDVTIADAPRQAQHLTDWLVSRGWVTASLDPGPRAFATGTVTVEQGGKVEIIAEPTLNMQGADIEAPLCPYCDTQVDQFALTDDISDDNPYPVVRCEGCGRDVAYLDWPGTSHPIMSNLTLALDSWMIPRDDTAASSLVAEIRAEMGGRWLQMWTHF
jgi:hypothetical protein